MGNFLTKMATRTVVGQTKKVAGRAVKGAVAGGATKMVTKALGLDDTLVGGVLQLGVPAMVLAAGKDESVAEKLFGNSKKKKDRKRPENADEAEKEFASVFGPMGKVMTKAIAGETGATEKQVGGILGMMLPDFEEAIAEENPKDARGLGKMFREEDKDARKDPSFARLATKMIF